MLYVGLDLSRKRLDWHAVLADGERAAAGACPPDRDGLAHLVHRLAREQGPVLAAIESMTGARFVHDQLEFAGWDVRIADAQREGLPRSPARPIGSTPGSWPSLPVVTSCLRSGFPIRRCGPSASGLATACTSCTSARRSRTASMRSSSSTALRAPVTDLFGAGGRRFLERCELPEPWRSTVEASLYLIDVLERQIDEIERELRRLGAQHRYLPLLLSVPGIGWVLGYTIAAEIGDIGRFSSNRAIHEAFWAFTTLISHG